ncbi:hypothetical protein HK100_012469 [Physocladia obscura]|uniref:G-protein coupled receptors family 1 profile domain-containing protein n=1 Tax=Physocladia obscura TaxID=109957 RepID=A0AAD5TFX3_9FUNG|nr:hypothetical protein HK100_012469 [Physocladia obscura]
MTIGIYVATYTLLSRRLAQALTSPLEVRIRLLLQKRILRAMIFMSASIFICYLPISVVFIAVGIFRKGPLSLWVRIVATEFALLDTIVTPILVLYFIPRIRHCAAARWTVFSAIAKSPFFVNSSEDDSGDSNIL